MPTYLFLTDTNYRDTYGYAKTSDFPDAKAARAYRDEHWPGCRIAELLGEAPEDNLYEFRPVPVQWDPVTIPQVMGNADATAPARPRSGLTRPLSGREAQIAAQREWGYLNKGIAKNLGVSPNTIRGHIQNMLAKGWVQPNDPRGRKPNA